jgi:hypothetical protein
MTNEISGEHSDSGRCWSLGRARPPNPPLSKSCSSRAVGLMREALVEHRQAGLTTSLELRRGCPAIHLVYELL